MVGESINTTHLDIAAKSTLGLPALRLNIGDINVSGVEVA